MMLNIGISIGFLIINVIIMVMQVQRKNSAFAAFSGSVAGFLLGAILHQIYILTHLQ